MNNSDNKSNKVRVAISMGDANGIGIEIILKTFEDKHMFDFFIPTLYAPFSIIEYQKRYFKKDVLINNLKENKQIKPYYLNIQNINVENFNVMFGKLTPESGHCAIKSLVAAVQSLKNDKNDILITAPIHKQNIVTDKFQFVGHTQYLAKELKGNALMFMIAERLKIALLTNHIPIKEVAHSVTPNLLEQKIITINESLKKDFNIIKPKIAILGMNPHAGDNGVIGTEDKEIIAPMIRQLFNKNILVFGPYSADSFFSNQKYLKYDAILAMYHDQGLIPFKTLFFNEGTNYTAGLDKIRVSPVHGVAFDIAGKGIADKSSFIASLFMGKKIFFNRKNSSLKN